MFLFCSLQEITMNWDLAIKRNSEVLAGVVETLFAMLGFVGEANAARLPWPTYRAVLRLLRPAESVLRRLIVVAARGLVIVPAASRPRRAGALKPGKGGSQRVPSFQLFDPQARIVLPRRRRPPRVVPRIHMFNADGEFITIGPPLRPAKSPAPARIKSPDGMVNAHRLIRRLEALDAALADIPRQARRLVRWRMREEKSENPSFKTPLRPGRPPGYRRRAVHPVDELLSECQWLAWEAMKPDTS
jgi:hypothetical protein